MCAALLCHVLAPAPARADDDPDEDAVDADAEDTVDVGDDAPAKPRADQAPKKQDLRGHAVDASSAANVFEKDRFFVDKVDTKRTAERTLIQGSLASSSFLYGESGGALAGNMGDAGSKYRRIFTELRLQTDFRHIGGGAWDARIDTRARVVNSYDAASPSSADQPRIQSGFNGENEYEVREAWIVRSGARSDLFFGRQFIADLGALKIDGLRVDYARSEKLTLIGFGGLYPIRGSRSITTDYPTLKDNDGGDAGRLVGAGGFGAAYRTPEAHGAFGGVALVPFSSESPRVYATSNGYLRRAKVDLYHNAIVDLVGSAGFALTNLSIGANYKPAQRLRLTASFNRVDTETLSVQANAFLDPAVTGNGSTVVQNEAFFTRLSTNAARVGASAALGQLQRFELSTAAAYRLRPEVTLTTPSTPPTVITLRAAQGVDVFAAFVDRRSFARLRLGVDVSRSFAVGAVAFQRSEVLAARVFASRELKEGRGEWEAEVAYSTTKDKPSSMTCGTTTPLEQCLGTSTGSVLSVGGQLYYRINRDWFALGNLFLSRQNITRMAGADPAITSLTGFARVAYRF